MHIRYGDRHCRLVKDGAPSVNFAAKPSLRASRRLLRTLLGAFAAIAPLAATAVVVNIGTTLNVTSSGPLGDLTMNGGRVRIEDPATGQALTVSVTNADLSFGEIYQSYSQVGGTTLNLLGDSIILGRLAVPDHRMYFRASPYDSQGFDVVNKGQVFQSAAGEVALRGPTRFFNDKLSKFEIQNDNGIDGSLGPNIPTFFNSGSLIKRSGSGISNINARFSASGGEVDSRVGQIRFNVGGSFTAAKFYADRGGSNAGEGIAFAGSNAFDGNTLMETGSVRLLAFATLQNLGTLSQKSAFSNDGSVVNEGVWTQEGVWRQQNVLTNNGRIEVFGAGNALYNANRMLNNGEVAISRFALFENSGTVAGETILGVLDGTFSGIDGLIINKPTGFFSHNIRPEMARFGGELGRINVVNQGRFVVEYWQSVQVAKFDNTAGSVVVNGRVENIGGQFRLTGGVLSGNGIINGEVFVGGGPTVATFKPGSSPGTFTVDGSLSLLPGGVLELEIERDPLTNLITHDRVVATSFSLDGKVVFLVGDGVESDDVTGLQFLDCGGACSVTYGSNFSFEFPGRSGSTLFMGENGLQISSLAPVPEPGTYAMLLAGLALVGGLASRRRRVVAT